MQKGLLVCQLAVVILGLVTASVWLSHLDDISDAPRVPLNVHELWRDGVRQPPG